MLIITRTYIHSFSQQVASSSHSQYFFFLSCFECRSNALFTSNSYTPAAVPSIVSDIVSWLQWVSAHGVRSEYPASIKYIIGNEFCERFSYYGLRAVLVLYCINYLQQSDDRATTIYHVFTMLAYFSPVFGGLLSDIKLGKYKTIVYLSLVYVAGNIFMSITAIPGVTDSGGGPPQMWGVIIGLLLVATGTGGIKPCVSAFGGDQFSPEQYLLLQGFFSMFYFSINAGSFISTIITPKLRGDVHCNGRDDCFPLAFGLPALLMFLATCLFLFGTRLYIRRPPQGNILTEVCKCIYTALKEKYRASKSNRKDHWLDYAEKSFTPELINDVKSLLGVLKLFLPLPIFWTLFDQQGSRWVLQARQMNGSLGSLGTIEPDQMQAANSLMILLLIPVFEKGVYPLCRKLRIPTRPLQRMSMGMLFSALAFVVAGFLQIGIDNELVNVVNIPGKSQVQLFSSDAPGTLRWTISQAGQQDPIVYFTGATGVIPYFEVSSGAVDVTVAFNETANATLHTTFASSGYYTLVASTHGNGSIVISECSVPFGNSLPPAGESSFRVINASPYNITNVKAGTTTYFEHISPYSCSDYTMVASGSNKAIIFTYDTNNVTTASTSLLSGGLFTALFEPDGQSFTFTDAAATQLHMLWQIPQYLVLTVAEVMFSITGLEFAYSQSPERMKAVTQAAWLLTVAFGNLVVVIIAESKPFEKQADEFFFFAGMLGIVLLIFMFLAYHYVYVDQVYGKAGVASKKPVTSEDAFGDGVEDEKAETQRLLDAEN